jgi:hypothetical protein
MAIRLFASPQDLYLFWQGLCALVELWFFVNWYDRFA